MIKDFIGVFANTLDHKTCDYFIKHFENMKKLGFTYSRTKQEVLGFAKKDESLSLLKPDSISMAAPTGAGVNPHFDHFYNSFWQRYQEYREQYGALAMCAEHNMIQAKLQKTLPTEGYHVWHLESSTINTSARVLVWMIYLNDVKDGGETEFLYQSMRVSPKKGTLVIWPAGFTHLHRGNPPLSGEKYIMTGWLEYV
jgi:hypothetical protein